MYSTLLYQSAIVFLVTGNDSAKSFTAFAKIIDNTMVRMGQYFSEQAGGRDHAERIGNLIMEILLIVYKKRFKNLNAFHVWRRLPLKMRFKPP